MEPDLTGLRYPLAVALLVRWRIDPSMVLEQGCYSDGFESFTPNRGGAVRGGLSRNRYDRPVYIHKWPHGFPWHDFKQRMEQDARKRNTEPIHGYNSVPMGAPRSTRSIFRKEA